MACYYRLYSIFEFLLGNGVNGNCRNFQEETPLLYAAAHGYSNFVKLMIKSPNVDLNCRSYRGQTPLSRAAEERPRRGGTDATGEGWSGRRFQGRIWSNTAIICCEEWPQGGGAHSVGEKANVVTLQGTAAPNSYSLHPLYSRLTVLTPHSIANLPARKPVRLISYFLRDSRAVTVKLRNNFL